MSEANITETVAAEATISPLDESLSPSDAPPTISLSLTTVEPTWTTTPVMLSTNTPATSPSPKPIIDLDHELNMVEIIRIEVEDPTGAVFSPNGRYLAISTKSGAIFLWDQQENHLRDLPSDHRGWIYRVSFSSDGKYLVSAPIDGTPRVWDMTTQELLDNYPFGSRGEISGIDFFSGDILAASGQDHEIVLWEMPRFINKGFHHIIRAEWIWGLGVSCDGHFLAAASADRKIYLFEMDLDSYGNYDIVPFATLSGHTGAVWSVSFACDNYRLASGSWDGTIIIWDVNDADKKKVLSGHTDWVYEVAFSPDSKVLASASKDGTVRLWDISTGAELATLEGHSSPVWSADFSPDGQFVASASDDGTVRIWGIKP